MTLFLFEDHPALDQIILLLSFSFYTFVRIYPINKALTNLHGAQVVMVGLGTAIIISNAEQSLFKQIVQFIGNTAKSCHSWWLMIIWNYAFICSHAGLNRAWYISTVPISLGVSMNALSSWTKYASVEYPFSFQVFAVPWLKTKTSDEPR